MKKKLLAMLLAAVMVTALLPTAFAADTSGKCGDNLTWTLSDGTLTITGTGPMDDYDNYYEDGFVPWWDLREEIRTVVIGDGVTSIGYRAFDQSPNLTGVTIPDSVTSIGGAAFNWCTSLTDVTIPDSVTSIGAYVFNYCESLTSVVIPDSVATIEDGVFCDCTSLTSVYIPVSVTAIGEFAFYCKSLTDVYYGGSDSQWKQISVSVDNDPLLNAYIHYNSAAPTTPAEPEEPAEPTAPTFTDVNANDWYYKEVQWAVDGKITNGTGDGTTFSPKRDCTHEQILTFLYRVERGVDMASADDMTAAVEWAREKGMIGDSFNGKDPCTRADAVNYIWQARGRQSGADNFSFEDVDAGADYAAAVDWAVANGVTEGTDSSHFSPDKVCNRGTIVTLLYRAYVEPLWK